MATLYNNILYIGNVYYYFFYIYLNNNIIYGNVTKLYWHWGPEKKKLK